MDLQRGVAEIASRMFTFATVVFFEKITICIAAVLLFYACSDTHSSNVADCFDLNRLEGRWEVIDSKTHQIEEWGVVGDKKLQGRGFVLDGRDTTFIEFLWITEESGTLTYFARPSDIHSDEVVPFTLEAENQDKLVFTNNQNDFPKKIVYQFHSDSLMQVYIEGPREGKTTRIAFDFVKQKTV